MWAKTYGSKWHFVFDYQESDRQSFTGKYRWKVKEVKTNCSSLGPSDKWVAVNSVRESINLNAAGICHYCRIRKIKELGLSEKKVMV